jgi:hypothetical protein
VDDTVPISQGRHSLISHRPRFPSRPPLRPGPCVRRTGASLLPLWPADPLALARLHLRPGPPTPRAGPSTRRPGPSSTTVRPADVYALAHRTRRPGSAPRRASPSTRTPRLVDPPVLQLRSASSRNAPPAFTTAAAARSTPAPRMATVFPRKSPHAIRVHTSRFLNFRGGARVDATPSPSRRNPPVISSTPRESSQAEHHTARSLEGEPRSRERNDQLALPSRP